MKVLVELLREYSAQSAEACGVDRRLFRIAGCQIDLRFAGQRWSDQLTKAFSHLAVTDRASLLDAHRLTVHLWDGSNPPRNAILRAYLTQLADHWFAEYAGPRGELLDLNCPSIRAFYHPGPDILSVVDLDEDVAYYWKRDLAPIPYYEAGSPLRALLHAWMSNRGLWFIHAAAIGTESGGVLLAGKGGSGKSTSALACLDSPLRYAGDDYCVVSLDGRDARAFSLYNTAKLNGDTDLERFPQYAPWVWNPSRTATDKATIFLYDHIPDRLISEFPLRAILLPVVTSEANTRLEPCGARDALLALAPSTMAQLPASGPADMAFIARLARSVPCFRLYAGRSLEGIPASIASYLDSESSLTGERDCVSARL